MIALGIALGSALLAAVLVAPAVRLLLPGERRPDLRASVGWATGAAFLLAFLAAWTGGVAAWPDPVLICVQATAAAVAVLVLAVRNRTGAIAPTSTQVVHLPR